MTDKFTFEELKEILRASAGVDDEVDLNGDIADVEFGDLGYDSLAVLEFTRQVERRYGVTISDSAIAEMPTPAKAVEFVNAQFVEARI